MPFGFGAPVFTSSAGGDIGGGRHYTRFRGPILVGAVSIENTFAPGGGSAGTLGTPWQAPHIANVSSQVADICLVPSTFLAGSQGPTLGTVTSSAPKGLVWVSMYGSSGTAGALIGAASPNPQTGGNAAAAFVFDGAYPTIAIYNPGTSSWLYPHAPTAGTTGGGGVITWSASSS